MVRRLLDGLLAPSHPSGSVMGRLHQLPVVHSALYVLKSESRCLSKISFSYNINFPLIICSAIDPFFPKVGPPSFSDEANSCPHQHWTGFHRKRGTLLYATRLWKQ